MTGGFVLYQRNRFELRVVDDGPLNDHVELWVDNELAAVIDTLGIAQAGDNVPSTYVELRVLNIDSLEAVDEDDAISFLYEVGG